MDRAPPPPRRSPRRPTSPPPHLRPPTQESPLPIRHQGSRAPRHPLPIQPVVSFLDSLDVESLRVKTDEALAIYSSLQLNSLLATDNDSVNSIATVKDRRSSESEISPSTSRADGFGARAAQLLRAAEGIGWHVQGNQDSSNAIRESLTFINSGGEAYNHAREDIDDGSRPSPVWRGCQRRIEAGVEIDAVRSMPGAAQRATPTRWRGWWPAGPRCEGGGRHSAEVLKGDSSKSFEKEIFRFQIDNGCFVNCLCDQPNNWRNQSISLTDLKEVEINGFRGQDHEVDLLKILLRCATALETDCEIF
uniref:FBD domain-containing protein n=1 Tax=Leersia perrieri TaxID=77586 RepID=A0A0D9VG56_9ORYZ